ncbi:hypothetical protein MKX01_035343 [Papaver californicum]|nr:hypothetical protein MKX01_035343 [Papaver californicum]
MSTANSVCCLCGDIGFPDKLFRCNKCCDRLQHSYCSNYYDDSASVANVSCDWCLHEERGGSSTTTTTATATNSGKKQISSSTKRSSSSSSGKDHEYNSSGEKIKKNDKESTATDQKGKNSGSPSPRTSGRRYKFLKDVLC